MEFFCYHRDRPGSLTLREELREQHWSYMDQYQAKMIARGPTLTGAGLLVLMDVEIVMFRDQRQCLHAIYRLQQGRAWFHLIKKGDQAFSVDGMIIDNQNFHCFILSTRPLALRK